MEPLKPRMALEMRATYDCLGFSGPLPSLPLTSAAASPVSQSEPPLLRIFGRCSNSRCDWSTLPIRPSGFRVSLDKD
ncbi:hypothetical protein EYF80_014774 [Liparis tanakae]|uniref:Uncharacterized protein n=1 Tax=Liparis tanakae TaxID=230148 RepID=A0A4Z2IAK8_9TELE|nr:hypothetical protein EYF80_014774 [Liparis tanakae]